MAEFLPTIGEHRHQQRQEERLQQQQAKQTIERDTDSFQVSSVSFSERDDDITTTNKTNSAIKFKDSFFPEKNGEREPLVASGGGVVVVGSGDISIDRKHGKQTKLRLAKAKTQFIDSRSILSNKEKLKKFWEHKMEMEFKLRQQSTLRTTNKQQPSNGQQKAAELDENNNRGSNNKHNNNNCSADIDGHQQQVQCASDEEWRSLSPNVEPTTLNGPFNKSFNRGSAKQVSVELICEKLREYQANNDEPVDKQPTTNGHTKSSSTDQDHPVRFDSETGSNRSSKQVPNEVNINNNLINNNNNLNNNCGHDETQLMSIDPTLCHPRETETEENNNSNNNFNFNGIKSSSSLAEDLVTTYNKQREEQTVNEEFSSSSNSSFGPMSISMPREEPTPRGESMMGNGGGVAKPESAVSDEDDLSSAQSGSVLTVINKFDSNDQKSQPFDISSQDIMLSDLEKASPFYNATLMQPEQSTNSSILPQSMVSENKPIDDNNTDGEGDEDESGSNIGVAFESLQFDSEIKSSKHEKVDDELLIAPTPVKRPAVPKFNAKEVKSVCHFITNAITDATRQVESYISGQTSATATNKAQPQQSKDGDHLMGSIQRATFIPRQTDSSDDSATKNGSAKYNVNSNSDDDDDDDYANDVQQAVEDEEEIPSADLSSIFEANVQREIERFETNSMIKKSLGGKLTDMNGLTKWRIAEEIRQFNEREMELKRRLEVNRKKDANGLTNGNNKLENVNDSIGDCNNMEILLKSQNQQQETAVTVVRFGKALQIPKPSSPATSQDFNQSTSLLPCKSIKLSTTSSGTSSNSSTISMHKFIASGGKRFIFTGSATGFNGNGMLQNQSMLTKSMSNLSTNVTKSEPQRTVDYKAVDSLKCKETPNVKPGLTRKVIETFSRLSHKSRFDSHQNLGPINTRNQPSSATSSNQQMQNGAQYQGSHNAPSAEWKIQEELREMRAREAELRSQRNNLAQKTTDIVPGDPPAASQQVDDVLGAGSDTRLRNENEQIRAIDRSQLGGPNHLPAHAMSTDTPSFSNESLYPIKQTIDSFKKLNSSSQSSHNGLSSIAQQHVGTTSNQRRQQATDNYVSD